MRIITGVIVAAVLTLAGCGSSESDKAKNGGDEAEAQVVCRDFVRDMLKSPSSADFSDEDASNVGGKMWQVTGSVDSENSFGAMIRNTYTCKVRWTGGDRYELVNLTGLGN